MQTNRDFNVTSRYKAYDADGNFKGVVVLNTDRKRLYEEKGYTFTRTTVLASWSRS